VLLVFQAMDAAGKDSTIRAVMQGVDRASIHPAARYSVSRNRRARNSTTIFSGERRIACRNVGASVFSIAVITRRCSSSGCIRRFSPRRRYRAN
jgi:hypothetical protein